VEAGEYVHAPLMTRTQWRAVNIAGCEDPWLHIDDTVWCSDTDERGTEAYAASYWFMHEDGDYYSFEEEREDRADDRPTYDYSTDILNVLDWPTETDGEAVALGVELEMEGARNGGHHLSAALGGRTGERHILKHDGSLSDGVELVTLPYTLADHRALFDWNGLLAAARSAGAKSHNTSTCGMHVHINRKALTPLQLGKMLVLVNHPANTHYIKQIAQRDPSRWAAFKKKKLTDGEKARSENRYEAINVGPRTAEIRIFRGNLRLDRVMKNLEFCAALVAYCAQAGTNRLRWHYFADWVAAHAVNYPELHKFIAEQVKEPAPGSFVVYSDDEEA
jgi:hypothetical protein